MRRGQRIRKQAVMVVVRRKDDARRRMYICVSRLACSTTSLLLPIPLSLFLSICLVVTHFARVPELIVQWRVSNFATQHNKPTAVAAVAHTNDALHIPPSKLLLLLLILRLPLCLLRLCGEMYVMCVLCFLHTNRY